MKQIETTEDERDSQLTLIFKELINLEDKGFSWSIGKTRLCEVGEYECRIFDTPVKPTDKRICVSGYSKSITECISLALNNLRSRGQNEKKSFI